MLNQVQNEKITSLLKNDNLFIMVIGGVASGKSFTYNKHFSSIPVVDIDIFKHQLSGGDWEIAKKMSSKAMKLVNNELEKYFSKKKSVVNMGTGATLGGVQKKLQLAKQAGMQTAIILVDVPVETAMYRNKLRASKGDRNLIPEYKVERSNNNARDNFKIFSNDADHAITLQG